MPDDPFYQPRRPLWLPPEMTTAPALALQPRPGPVEPRTALLVNPFYAKSPHGSFGKHVLTPSLALTSIAAATPPGWRVRYWDENLLQGPPPIEPFPQVVGITVHLTFARRAYELAAWYRARGSTVVLGGLHVQACEEEAAPHADASASATACRPGRPSCATSSAARFGRATRRVSSASTTSTLRPGATSSRATRS